jgi:hypothetical protein
MYGQRTGSTRIKTSVETMHPRDEVRLLRLARELRLADQILSDDVEALEVVDSLPYPAVTSGDGRTISFSMQHMPHPDNRKAIAVWLGTNAHELGHSLFSPRAESPLMRRIISGEKSTHAGIFQAWNILEDQRMERLVLGRFAPWRGYLTTALAKHVDVRHQAAWLLMAGRTWLPSEARALARSMFEFTYDTQTTVEVEQLIGAYQALGDPGDDEADGVSGAAGVGWSARGWRRCAGAGGSGAEG